MSDDQNKKYKVNRRDFLTAGIGAVTGAAIFGVTSDDKNENSEEPISRNPAGDAPDKRNIANNYKKLRGHYPYVVIGSGYGGSVLAARLSAAGKKVCILERGKEWHPGMFPQDGKDLAKSQRNVRNARGLLDMNMHEKGDVDVICASGLGGTSLLNAAIASRP